MKALLHRNGVKTVVAVMGIAMISAGALVITNHAVRGVTPDDLSEKLILTASELGDPFVEFRSARFAPGALNWSDWIHWQKSKIFPSRDGISIGIGPPNYYGQYFQMRSGVVIHTSISKGYVIGCMLEGGPFSERSSVTVELGKLAPNLHLVVH